MKLAAIALALSLAFVMVGEPRAEDVTAVPAQQSLVRRLTGYEQEAWRLYARRDVRNSRRRLAADYSDLQADGRVLDRAGHLAFVPTASLASWRLDQFRVFRLTPTSVIVSYRARTRDRAEGGETAESTALVTSGWALRRGEWLNIFYRETPSVE